jgi:hypothetical protein
LHRCYGAGGVVVVVVVVVFLSVSTGASVVVVLLVVEDVVGAGATGVTLVVDFLEQPTLIAPMKMRAATLVVFNISGLPASNYRADDRGSGTAWSQSCF